MIYTGRLSTSNLLWSFLFLSWLFVLYSWFIKQPTVSIPAFDIRYTKNIPPPSLPAKYANIAVLVEFRSIDRLVTIVMNILHNIPSSWHIQIFHGKTNLQFIKNSSTLRPLIASRRILLTEWETEFTKDFVKNTNKLFTDISFWQQIQGDKILFFQLDSIMCSNSPHKITDYLHYDYIGAPWDLKKCCGVKDAPVGNGGFSLRSRIKTIQLLKMIKWEEKYDIPEDLWFPINLRRYLNASIAPVDVAKTFSVESIFYSHPMAVHKLLLSYSERRRLYETCPEARLVPPYFFLF
jgi:hypothetical protein